MSRRNGNGRRFRPRCAICRRILRDFETVLCSRCTPVVRSPARPA